MKSPPILPLLFLVCSFLLNSSCTSEKPKSTVDTSNIDFFRGDIVMCSGQTFGEVSFSLSCDYSVRETFDLAVSLLHSFEYREAEKAFVQVLDADTECAMAYWGVAMSIYHAAWSPPGKSDLAKASEVLEVGKSAAKNAREMDYLNAIGTYYKDWDSVAHGIRAKNYEKAMERMYEKYEDDTEAAVFYALALYATRDRSGTEYVNEKKAGKILEAIFPDQPNHPGVAHYIIHNYDNPDLAHLALPTARRYADIAPGSAHAQHMPSHIFTRLGLWDESIQSNLNSMSAARCYAEETAMDGTGGEEVHAMDYLIYAYLQQGDNAKAGEMHQRLLSMDKLAADAGKYNFGSISARMWLENKNWTEAARLEQHPSNVDWGEFPWEIAITHFARVLGAVHNKDIDAAKEDLRILESLHQRLVNADDPYQAKQVLVQVTASRAWIKLVEGYHEAAVTLMQEAAGLEAEVGKHPVSPGEVLPAQELLGDMMMVLGRPKEALSAYLLNLQSHPNRFNGVYGAAVAAKRAGEHKTAKEQFSKLVELTAANVEDRTEVIEAKQYLNEI
ncbi:tetratricopeptide repeat protein [Neolewinella persica]|uniref:tetratricopeptide repeat protein n=1 Tax=Neolewinella persica TaxID=70998 RepID=UPI00037194E2|nr:hypothetical protein [Neolewinella persica]